MPFQKLTRSTSGPVHKFLDGWTITGITRFTTGLPILLSESGDIALSGVFGGVDRPNYTGAPIKFVDPRASSNHAYFVENFDPAGNPVSPFFGEELGVAGNASRRFFHGPGLNNWDFALHKATRITEQTSMEFRAELFNIFNHAQIANPSGDINSSTFGQVTGTQADPRIARISRRYVDGRAFRYRSQLRFCHLTIAAFSSL